MPRSGRVRSLHSTKGSPRRNNRHIRPRFVSEMPRALSRVVELQWVFSSRPCISYPKPSFRMFSSLSSDVAVLPAPDVLPFPIPDPSLDTGHANVYSDETTTQQNTIHALHLVNGEHYSGAERVQDLLAARLPQNGCEVGF